MTRGRSTAILAGAANGLRRRVRARLARLTVSDPTGASHPLDLRLLLPALTAWAVLAVVVSRPARGQLWCLVGAVALAAGAAPLTRVDRARTSALARAGCLAALLAALLLAGAVSETARRGAGPLTDLRDERAVVTLRGTVVTDPAPRLSRVDERGAAQRWTSRIDAIEITGRGRTGPAHGPVRLSGGSAVRDLRWHGTVSVPGRLGPAPPGSGDVAVLTVAGPIEEVASPGLVAATAETLRRALRQATAGLPPDARGLVPGLVIGDTTQTPPDLTEAMRTTGLTHLTAVSGSNVSVVLTLVLGCCSLLGVRRRLRMPLAALALAGFVVLARPDPSVLRAATMGAIGLIGLSRRGRTTGPAVLASAVMVLLLLDPWLARSYGFALSTLATVGLLVFVRPWGAVVSGWLPRRLSGFGPLLVVPVAAQLMCAPVIVVLQESVSLVGVLANLLAAPFVGPATIAGVAVALVAPVLPGVGGALAWAAGLPALAVAAVARHLESVPAGTIPWRGGLFGALLLAAATVAGVLIAPWAAYQCQRRPVAAVWVLGLTASVLTPTSVLTWPPQNWVVVFCDVGEGDATVLRAAADAAVVIDTGPEPELVRGCLRRLGVRAVPLAVLTHYHADHVDGLPGVLSTADVTQVLATPYTEPRVQVEQVARWVGERGIPIGVLRAGDTVSVGDVTARVLSPARLISAGSLPNNNSLAIAAEVGPASILVLADLEREGARDLLLRIRRDPQLSAWVDQVDAVRTNHHGSANLDPGLVERTRAQWAVVSVGRNDYGHPTAAHLTTYRRNGYAVHRTDEEGDIALVAGPDGLVLVSEHGSAPRRSR